MNVADFKRELLQLLTRYAAASVTDNHTSTPEKTMPLGHQQMLDTIYEAVRATLHVNLEKVAADTATMKTPMNEIVITTPNAPDVLRVDGMSGLGSTIQSRFSSVDASLSEDDIYLKLTDPAITGRKPGDQKPLNNGVSAAKSTASDNKEAKLTKSAFKNELFNNNLDSFDKKFKAELAKNDCNKNMAMFAMVDEAHKNSVKVMGKLEELRQLLMPESRPIRRLSAIMNLPISKPHQAQHQHPSSASSNLRSTMQQAKVLRRSMQHQANDEVPVTPTTSRPCLAALPSVAKKPSVSAIVKPMSKLAQQHRSSSLMSLESTKSAASSAASSAPKSPSKSVIHKNPKYAHVQSTIPKPVALKRKT